MARGIGIDIIEIHRIGGAIDRHEERFVEKVFTQTERDYCNKHRDSNARYAGRFAAKEAVVKALGTGFSGKITWQDIEITNDQNGKPGVQLSPKLQQQFNNPELLISISHSHNYATAVAILL